MRRIRQAVKFTRWHFKGSVYSLEEELLQVSDDELARDLQEHVRRDGHLAGEGARERLRLKMEQKCVKEENADKFAEMSWVEAICTLGDYVAELS